MSEEISPEGTIDGFNYKFLGKVVQEEKGKKTVTRIGLLIELKKKYTTWVGTTKTWAPFYISSGTYGGTEAGDIAHFKGTILNDGITPSCKLFYERITAPVRSEIEKETRDQQAFIDNQLKHITSNCVSYFLKCSPNNLNYIFYEYLLYSNGDSSYDYEKQMSLDPKELEVDITEHYNEIHDIISKHKTPKFNKIRREDVKKLISNSIDYQSRFIIEEDYSSKICSEEFSDINDKFRKFFHNKNISKIPPIDFKELNSKIGTNNMFGVNLDFVRMDRKIFDYSIWKKYKKKLLSIALNKTLVDIDMFPNMNEIILNVLEIIHLSGMKKEDLDTKSREIGIPEVVIAHTEGIIDGMKGTKEELEHEVKVVNAALILHYEALDLRRSDPGWKRIVERISERRRNCEKKLSELNGDKRSSTSSDYKKTELPESIDELMEIAKRQRDLYKDCEEKIANIPKSKEGEQKKQRKHKKQRKPRKNKRHTKRSRRSKRRKISKRRNRSKRRTRSKRRNRSKK